MLFNGFSMYTSNRRESAHVNHLRIVLVELGGHGGWRFGLGLWFVAKLLLLEGVLQPFGILRPLPLYLLELQAEPRLREQHLPVQRLPLLL